MPEDFLTFLNVMLAGSLGMWSNAHWMDKVLARRHSLAVFWGYFLTKTCITFLLQYSKIFYGAPWADVAVAVFVSVAAVLTTAAAVYTWKGAFAQIFMCAFVCDTINATSLTSCVYGLRALPLGLFVTGEWYFVPFGLGTILLACMFLLIHFALTGLLVSLLEAVKRVVLRHEVLWTILTWVFVFGESVGTYMADMESNSFFVDLQIEVAILLVGMLLFVVLGRTVRLSRRSQAVEACETLAREYDAKVRAQLGELERGRLALAGHERVLNEIGSGNAGNMDDDIAQEVRALEQKFSKLRAGSYCDMPALDAVLCAGADYLSALGVRATLTVAGVDESTPVPVAMVYSLLGLACDVADRQRSVEGGPVDLRIRSVGEGLSLGLEVPKRWGRLGARRRLVPLADEQRVLVRETADGDRRQVLMLC